MTLSAHTDITTQTLVEAISADQFGMATAVRDTMQAVLKLRGEVEADVRGVLPNDGKVIDDIRKFG